MKEVSYDYLSCIYLSENMLKTAILKVFYFKMQFIYKAEFSASLLQSSVSHDLSEIILILI